MATVFSQAARDAESVPLRDATLHVTAARTLALYERVIHGTANTATDSYTLTLPPVGEAAGLTFSIYAELIANSKTITIADRDDSIGWTDKVLDTTADRAILQSDGKRWNVVEQEIA